MTARRLLVRMHDTDVGEIERDTHGRPVLRYADAWRESDGAIPLSISLPLASTSHRKAIEPYLWGLLPDNDTILDQWGARFHVPRNAMELLAHVGSDCPGAIRLLTEESAAQEPPDEIVWLEEKHVAERLRRLREDSSAWRDGDEAGQFSLGGAQAKTALLLGGERWGVPSGRIPTTHILKPGIRELDGHAENEHFCLSLVRELRLPAAHSRVLHFGPETALVVERYDRAAVGTRIVRIHQEDFCQATATMPNLKYQNDGGPSPKTIVDLLRTYSADADADVATFVEGLVVAWAIVATDGHAKNYSLLHARAKVRLAPLYDVASILPYAPPELRRTKLAMRIGGKYRVNEIGLRDWLRFADEISVGPDFVRGAIARILDGLPDAANTVRKAAQREGIRHGVVSQLADAIAKRARSLARQLEAARR